MTVNTNKGGGLRVHLGADHAGLELKARLVTTLKQQGHEPVDHGPHVYDPDDDYPPFVLSAATAVAQEPGSLGVVLGGSGNGEAIAANKVAGIRAALAFNEDTARLAREHNDANVLSLGARMYDDEGTAVRLVEIFLTARFSHEEHHLRRIRMISDYETSGLVPMEPSR
jgi:ribose 5-phosphate isomerase B